MMKKRLFALCLATAFTASVMADHRSSMMRPEKPSYYNRMHMDKKSKMYAQAKGRHINKKGRAKKFMGKYLDMTPEQQAMIRTQIVNYIKNHEGPNFISNLRAKINTLVGNPPNMPLSNLMKKVNALPTKQEKIAFLKKKWGKLSRESKRRAVTKAARMVNFAEVVQHEGLMSHFKDQIESIKERLKDLEDKGSMPAESEKVTARLKKHEEMPVEEDDFAEQMLSIDYE